MQVLETEVIQRRRVIQIKRRLTIAHGKRLSFNNSLTKQHLLNSVITYHNQS